MDMSYLTGPLIGAVIGYFTNYLAVKMLFHPRKAIKVGKFTLPFTPGAIPKGKDRLATAVGNAVGNTLLTPDALKNQLLSEDVENVVVGGIYSLLDENIKTVVIQITGSEEKYEKIESSVISGISGQIMESVDSLPIEELLATEVKDIIKEKISGTMLKMFITDDLLNSLLMPVGEKIREYIQEKGPDFVEQEVTNKVSKITDSSVADLLEPADISKDQLYQMIKDAYKKIIEKNAPKIIEKLSIPAIIEEKIKAMKVEELEELVLSVMKKELNMIVNLGALIGFVIGLLNIII